LNVPSGSTPKTLFVPSSSARCHDFSVARRRAPRERDEFLMAARERDARLDPGGGKNLGQPPTGFVLVARAGACVDDDFDARHQASLTSFVPFHAWGSPRQRPYRPEITPSNKALRVRCEAR
jgi:hypothetical protein